MTAHQPIPVYTTLSDVFGGIKPSLEHALRWDQLIEEFETRFGKKPTYIARAPGRVNLIGEHIDYALFGVLPAAIERDILIACAPRSSSITATNDSGDEHQPGAIIAENLQPKYNRQTFTPKLTKTQNEGEEGQTLSWDLGIDTTQLRWESYVKAGYYGVLEQYFSDGDEEPVPADILVTGSVPAGSGLSSSAAMVVASTLAFLAVNGKFEEGAGAYPLNKGGLVDLAMQNERRVGVNSGGMDQAASVMSDPSSALYITFYPALSASPVPLPPKAVFVCANSLVVADKAVGAKRGYNLRVVETLVGARILAKSLDLWINAKERITYRDVASRFGDESLGGDMGSEALERVLETLEGKIDVLKPKEVKDGELGVTMDEMVEMSGLSKAEFDEIYLSWVEIEATHFQLYKRAKHVLSEARRVLQFQRTCLETAAAKGYEAGDAGSSSLEILGRLMNDSQKSCSELFECSCPELDELTRLAREAGALGSRLTGAGWGGCTVSLVPEGKVQEFIERVQKTYGPYKDLQGAALSEAIFATKPGPGACVFKVTEE